MGKQNSIDVRELVIKYHEEGKSLGEIGSIINGSHNNVKKIIDKYKRVENWKTAQVLAAGKF